MKCKRRTVLGLTAAIVAALQSLPAAAQGASPNPARTAPASGSDKLQVFQDLEEATARIARLGDRPYEKLWDANGCYQCETIIFKDLETGKEVWSLSMELCTDLANIERRCAWSRDGRYISFIGNKVFWNHLEGKLWKRQWSGYNYVADADGSSRRKLWGRYEGKLLLHQDKFNTWDQAKGNVLYYAGGAGDTLWRITLGEGEKGNLSEPIYKFPVTAAKAGHIIQDISDENLAVVEESGGRSMKEPRDCYLFDLNKDPKDPRFCRTCQLKGEGHGGSFRIHRGSPVILTGGYEDRTLGAFRFRLDEEKGLVPAEDRPETKEYQVHMAHLAHGPPDDRVAFSGDALGQGFGLWVLVPGRKPVRCAITNDGHPTWCGHDEDWFFYSNGTGDVRDTDKRLSRRLLAGSADGNDVRIICTPWDRRRGTNEGGYDAIPRPNQSPDATKCWFHSSMLNPSNAYTGSFIAVFRRPYAPTGVELRDGRLSWTPHKLSYEVKGCLLYRKEGQDWQLVAGPIQGTSVKLDKDGTYMLTSLEWSGLESETSSPTIAAPSGARGPSVTGFDKTPPPAVTGFAVAREADGQYRLKWDRNPAKDLRHYNVYFSTQGRCEAGQKRLIISPPGSTTEYLDWTAPLGVEGVYYAITAVDRQGNESAPAHASVGK